MTFNEFLKNHPVKKCEVCGNKPAVNRIQTLGGQIREVCNDCKWLHDVEVEKQVDK